jgi:hypothetical protein
VPSWQRVGHPAHSQCNEHESGTSLARDCTATGDDASLSAEELRHRLLEARFQVDSLSLTHFIDLHRKRFGCEVRWRAEGKGKAGVPQLLRQFEQLPGIIELEWKAVGTT